MSIRESREEPGSLMAILRQHATIPDGYSWATLGIKVPEAQRIVAQIDLMNDGLAELREQHEQVKAQGDVAGELIATVRTIVETWRNDPGAYPDGAADPLDQIATVLLGPDLARRDDRA